MMQHDDLIFIPPAKRHFDVWGYVFIAPALVMLALFVFYPLLWTLLHSVFESGTAGTSGRFIGLTAYMSQLKSPVLWRVIINTLYFALIYAPLSLLGGYLIAQLVKRAGGRKKWPLGMLAIFFMPVLLSAGAAGTIWRWIYSADSTLMTIAGWLLGREIDLLSMAYVALPAIAVVCAWQSAGFIAVMFAAAMPARSRDTDDDARLQGMSRLQAFLRVTWPSLKHVTLVSVALLAINVNRVFDLILIMTGDGGPSVWTTNLPFLIYRRSMLEFDFSSSSALAVLVCFSITILVVLLRRYKVQMQPVCFNDAPHPRQRSAKMLLLAMACLWILPPAVFIADVLRIDGGGVISDIRLLVGNSITAAVASALIWTFLAAPAGYALAHRRFFGRKILHGTLIGIMFFPPVAFLAGLFHTTVSLGIYDSLSALILPSAAAAFAVVFCTAAFSRVSASTIDAARIDGLGEASIFLRIVLPQVRRALAALFLILLMVGWGSITYSLAVVDSPGQFTLGLSHAVSMRRGMDTSCATAQLVMVSISALPVFLLFIFSPREIIVSTMDALFRFERSTEDVMQQY